MTDIRRLLFEPNIRIYGLIGDQTVTDFLVQLKAVRDGEEDLILEINTLGGDADAARRIALEIRLFIRHSGKKAECVGKTAVYSAGVTILAAFPKNSRHLTDDATLLIHERRLSKSVQLDGPMRSNMQIVLEQQALLKTAERMEMDGFKELTEGSNITVEELYERATENFYLTAAEALDLGLIESILK